MLEAFGRRVVEKLSDLDEAFDDMLEGSMCDRARIATCNLLTPTDKQQTNKDKYSTDDNGRTVRKESMVLADKVVLCGGNPIDVIEYLESWRKALEESVDQKRSGCMFEQADRA